MASHLDSDEKPQDPKLRRKWQGRQQDYLAWVARERVEDARAGQAAPAERPSVATDGKSADPAGGARRQGRLHQLEQTRPRYRPIYVIQHSSLQDHPNPLAVIEHLVDKITDPRWRRDALCHGCESWSAKGDGLSKYPHRPGAWDTAHVSCSGCWYSYLIDVRRLERIARRRAGASRPVRRKPRPRKEVEA